MGEDEIIKVFRYDLHLVQKEKYHTILKVKHIFFQSLLNIFALSTINNHFMH